MYLPGHPEKISELQSRTFLIWSPPPRFNVAEYADKFLWLPRSMSSEPGKYRCDRLPYQKEPQESAADPSSGGVVLLWAKQMGKTQIFLNTIAYVIDADPSMLLIKYPTLDSAKKFSQKKLGPFIRANDRLRNKIMGDRYRDEGNTILTKDFVGGSITMIGANSVTGLRQLSCKWILQDEIDSDKNNAEGDPVEQADGRAENFHDACFLKASTPTIRGQSRIEEQFERSDKRYWHVACPKCEGEQILKWAGVEWPKDHPEDAFYRCQNCREPWTDIERIRAIMGGRWIATNPGGESRGYHLSGLYRVMGKKRKYTSYLHEFADSHLRIKGDRGKRMFWVNTFLAETFIDDFERISTDPLMGRREKYGPKVPWPVCVLTCAVDVQADRIEWEVIGWGAKEESWGIERGTIYGNPHKDQIWKDLEEIRVKKWEHESGFQMAIDILGIDTGGNFDNYAFSIPVYRYVMAHKQASRGQTGVIAIKGSAQSGAPLAQERKQKNGINLLLVGTDRAKATIYERLKLTEKGPGFQHFPMEYEEEFFLQLASEDLRTILRNGFSERHWVKNRARNEALDIRVYNLALLEILNPNFAALAAMVGAKSEAPEIPKEKEDKPAEKLAEIRRIVRRPPGRRFGMR